MMFARKQFGSHGVDIPRAHRPSRVNRAPGPFAVFRYNRVHADHASTCGGVTCSSTCLRYFRGAAYRAIAAKAGTVGTNILA